MSALNQLLRPLFDGLLYPFRGLHPMVGVALVSLLTAVAMLLVFKKTSNQEKLAAVKRRIHAGLFEIRLFNDDLRAILRAQGQILGHNLNYIRLTIVPLLVMLPFIALMFAQLEFHYGYRALQEEETALLTARLESNWEAMAQGSMTADGRPRVELEMPDGVSLDSAAVWVPTLQEMTWRLRAEQPGQFRIGVRLGDQRAEKTVRVGGGIERTSPHKPKKQFDQFLYPAEEPLEAQSPFASLDLAYPVADVSLLGLAFPWWLWWLLLALVFALALRNRMGVTI